MNWRKSKLHLHTYIQIYKINHSFTFKTVATRFCHVRVHLEDNENEVDGTF